MNNKVKEQLKQKLNEWDWKTELERAHKETSNLGRHSVVPADADGEGGFDPRKHGLYKADKSHEVLTPGEVQKRAEAYIHQYGKNGYKIENVGKNADGSWSFATVKAGKVVHHTFHKTGGRTQSVGGEVVDHDETANDAKTPAEVKGKPADFSALYKAMGLPHTPPKVAAVPTSQKEKALKSIKSGGHVKVGNVSINRMSDEGDDGTGDEDDKKKVKESLDEERYESDTYEGDIHDVKSSPDDVEDKLNLHPGALDHDMNGDGRYSKSSIVKFNGKRHTVYSNRGSVRVRTYGHSDESTANALVNHIDGVVKESLDEMAPISDPLHREAKEHHALGVKLKWPTEKIKDTWKFHRKNAQRRTNLRTTPEGNFIGISD